MEKTGGRCRTAFSGGRIYPALLRAHRRQPVSPRRGRRGSAGGEGRQCRATVSKTAAQPWRGESTLRQFTHVSVMGSSCWSPLPYFRAHGECDSELLALFNRTEHDVQRSNGIHARGQQNCGDDVVKLWDNSHLTIWRPGLLHRDKPRVVKELLRLFFSRVDVKDLAEVIVDDIITSVAIERGFDATGSTKIVSGSNAAVRVKAKRAESEGLQYSRRMAPTPDDP
ncbi:hypothetical protein TRSC58_04388 [Trypanosoma rangeli SC58]|uniref:Uncharacterized protein n=1 Tax=Trypanosoma rangeli SC58 TaxID=429131 RepID=A0A061IXP4_TRYRA|nr:hypothetical protein TRSC58_04388 [Trypanosoma rangeli SC58]